MPETPTPPSSVQRALRVLEVVAAAPDGVQAKAVARRLGYTLPTTYRLLHTLVEEGYLVHLGEPEGFGLGYKIPPLYEQLRRRLEVDPAVAETVHTVHRQSGAAAYYSTYRDREPVIAHVADSPETPRIRGLDIGFGDASHATAFGKLMLSALTPDQARAQLDAHGMPRLTPQTITNADELEEQLPLIRSTGIAVEIEELQRGIACMSAAVTLPDGRLVGAVSASLVVDEFHHQLPRVEKALRDGAEHCATLIADTLRQGSPQ